jgi:N-acetylneuraminate lyase
MRDLKENLSGIFSALVTPFRPDGGIDIDALAALAEFQIRQGVHGFYVGGSTGEAALQTVDERKQVLSAFASAVAGRRPLIAHVGAIATDDSLVLAEAAANAGYAAISAIAPYYYEFRRSDLLNHYDLLANATPLPLIIYNFPQKMPKPWNLAELLGMLDHPKIIGVKHTSQNLYQLERLKQASPQSLLFNGFDEMFVGGMAMGADGAIGTTYNFMGDIFVAAYEAAKSGDFAAALRFQTRANHVIDVLIDVGVIPGTKAFLKHLGVDCGICRAPFRPLTAREEAKVVACIENHLVSRSGPARGTH